MRIDSAFLVDVLSPHVSALSAIYVWYNIFNVVSTLVLTTGSGPLVVWWSVSTVHFLNSVGVLQYNKNVVCEKRESIRDNCTAVPVEYCSAGRVLAVVSKKHVTMSPPLVFARKIDKPDFFDGLVNWHEVHMGQGSHRVSQKIGRPLR
jgi:hypothetical protein